MSQQDHSISDHLFKVHSHQAAMAASASSLPLALLLGMGLEPIFQRQHQRQPM